MKIPQIKILHCSDIHIFNSKKFEVHEYVFNEFYKQIEKELPDIIVIAGDLVDSKGKLSAEQITLARSFLLNLTSYAPVILTLGNHDTNLANKDRLDSLTPIVQALNNEVENPIHYLKHTGLYNLYGIDWAVWSCWDNQRGPEITNENFTIGLYHGTIKGCIAENGFTLTEGIDVEEFVKCNRVLLGDIHKTQFFRNREIAYPGAILQTKITETANGHYLVWENGLIPRVCEINNPFSTITFNIDDEINAEETQNVIINYDSSKYTKLDIQEKKKQIGRKVEFKPLIKKREKKETKKIELNTVRSLEEYIETLKLPLTDKDKVFEFDKEFGKDILINYDLGDFSIEQLSLNNFLSFAPRKQGLIFTNKFGIIGINGKNRIGKSSLLTAISFCLYNSSRDNSSSLKKLINKHNRSKECFVELILKKNSEYYKIRRTLIPKKKEGITIELEFELLNDDLSFNKSIKGEKRQDTEKEIQKIFGLESAFDIMSIYSAQKKQVEFIDCKNSERLVLINRFLGLQIYEEKEKIVAEELKKEKGILQSLLSNFNRDLDINLLESSKQEFHRNKLALLEDLDEVANILKVSEYQNRHLIAAYELTKKIANKDVANPVTVNKEILENNERAVNILTPELISQKKCVESTEEILQNIKIEYKEKFDLEIDAKINEREKIEDEKELAVLQSELKSLEKQFEQKECSVCGSELKNKNIIEENILTTKTKIEILNKTFEQWKSILKEKLNLVEDYNLMQTNLKKYNLKIVELKKEIKEIETKNILLKDSMKEWDEVVKAKNELIILSPQYQDYITLKKKNEEFKQNLNIEIGIKTNKINELEKSIEEYKKKFEVIRAKEEEVRLLKLYKDIIHKDALPLYILQSKIEDVNAQINLIVQQIFDFTIEFSIEDGDLNIEFYYDGDEEKNDVSFASGAETFIINLCIKIGLSRMSELPKITTLFIDEGYGTLDKENIDKLPQLFSVLPEYYDNIITISHLDELKDLYQYNIQLKKEDRYTEII